MSGAQALFLALLVWCVACIGAGAWVGDRTVPVRGSADKIFAAILGGWLGFALGFLTSLMVLAFLALGQT